MNAPPGQGPPGLQQPYQQQPPYYAPHQPIPPTVEKPDETLALVALILSITSWVMGLLILTSIPAVICGHIAKSRVRNDPQRYGGDVMATIGLVIGWVNVGVTAVGILAILAMILLPFCAACGLLGIGAASG
jgi:hypothetical protein